jgi:hypothetical protein
MPPRKSDGAKPKGKPRGRAFPKKETPVEENVTVPPTAEEQQANQTLNDLVAAQVAAKRAPASPRRSQHEIDAEIVAGTPKEFAQAVRATPRDQADQTLGSLVDQQRATPTKKSPAAALLPPIKKGETALQYQERLADILTTAENEKRKAFLKARKLGTPKSEMPVYNVFIPTRKDAAEPPMGAQVKDGWKQTWVRRVNSFGEPDPSLSRVQEMRGWGYEVVLDAENKPVQSRLGVLMQGPPEQRAARVAHLTPVGARKPKHYEDEVRQFVENTNRQYGKNYVSAFDQSDQK